MLWYSHPAPALPTPYSELRELRMWKNRILALDSWVHIKGMISMSPDLCTFPYTEKD